MLATSNVYSGFLQKLRRYIRRHEMLLGGEPLLVAVSGGIDSMVLLDMLIRLSPTMNLTLAVAHYEHGLRGEASKEDAQFVVEAARRHGLKAYVGHGDVKQIAEDHKLSIEEAARRARYTFLRKVARKHRFPVVATGHTANDNAETVLLNLIRGSGVRGLAAIPPMRQMGEGVILARPLLDFERSEVERYAKELEIEWREDESNESARFVRNRLRSELLPMLQAYNPAIVGTLNTTAEIMRNLEQYLSQSVQTAIERVTVEKSKERIALNLHQIRHFLPAMQTEIVQRGVSQAFDIPPISFSATERALALLYKETGQKTDLGAGLTALRDRDALVVLRELPIPPELEHTFAKGGEVDAGRIRLKSSVMPRDRVQFSKNGRVEYFDADKIPDEMVLRSWREGDRFHPLGMEGEKKVSDFLVDSKTPRDRKRHVLVLTADDQIIWVCGMRIDDRYKLTDATTNVLRIEMLVLSPNQLQVSTSGETRGGRGGQRGSDDRGRRNEGGRRGDKPQPRDTRSPLERAKDDRPRDTRAKDDRARVDRAKDDRAKDDRARDDRARDDRARDDRGRNDRARDDRARDDRGKTDGARDDRARDDRAKDDRARDDRAKDDRARDDRAKDDRSRDVRTRDDRAKDDRPRDDRAKDDRPRDDRTRGERPNGERARGDRKGGARGARGDRRQPKAPRVDKSASGEVPAERLLTTGVETHDVAPSKAVEPPREADAPVTAGARKGAKKPAAPRRAKAVSRAKPEGAARKPARPRPKKGGPDAGTSIPPSPEE